MKPFLGTSDRIVAVKVGRKYVAVEAGNPVGSVTVVGK